MNNYVELPNIKRLADYQPTNFKIAKTDLTVDISNPVAKVISKLVVTRNPKANDLSGDLVLDLESLKIEEIIVNGVKLRSEEYQLRKKKLIISLPNEDSTVEITSTCLPYENHSCMGLYASGSMLLTQMEAEGFRRLTPYLDRPDNMSVFTTKIISNKEQYPVLLSNGNLIGREELPNGKHSATFFDPFPKPCYLFALVAGDLVSVKRKYTTLSDREINIEIYVEAGDENRVDHALNSLEKAMRWDEERFGLEYDLDTFYIVATERFNFGAMENKGLNIFNSAAVLANLRTATDERLDYIERVVAHEYFHNYSGNRVTCRDWFQLTLKEGLTVFRDQEFSSDLHDRSLRRIQNVKQLKKVQFSEDRGPNSHPIRPDSYVKVNNFYTPTIYEKGSEVIRMLTHLLPPKELNLALRHYFAKFDGLAITTDDFLDAVTESSGLNLEQFRRWYSQKGIPRLVVTESYNKESEQYTISFEQRAPTNCDPEDYKSLVIPIKFALFNPNNESYLQFNEETLVLTEKKKELIFTECKARPLASVLRGFSAPVDLVHERSVDEYLALATYDTDLFNRYDAIQRIIISVVKDESNLKAKNGLFEVFSYVLNAKDLSLAFKAFSLQFPSLREFVSEEKNVDFYKLWCRVESIKSELALNLKEDIVAQYNLLVKNPDCNLLGAAGLRDLKNTLLSFISYADRDLGYTFASRQFEIAQNMSDEIAALSILCRLDTQDRTVFLDKFYKRWHNKNDVLSLWFAVQVQHPRLGLVEEIKTLAEHPIFDHKSPNLVRALFFSFCQNLPSFHRQDSYQLIANEILTLNLLNTHLAAQLAKMFIDYPILNSQLAETLKKVLERIISESSLSESVYEIIFNILHSS
jgi:aminopeptidase N